MATFGDNGITVYHCANANCIGDRCVTDATTGYCSDCFRNPPTRPVQPAITHRPEPTPYERAIDSARRARAAGHVIAAAHHEARAARMQSQVAA